MLYVAFTARVTVAPPGSREQERVQLVEDDAWPTWGGLKFINILTLNTLNTHVKTITDMAAMASSFFALVRYQGVALC